MLPTERFVGGLRVRRGTASWPFICLTVGKVGLSLGPSHAWLRPLIPTYDVPYADVKDVGVVKGAMADYGVQFRLREPVSASDRIAGARLWTRDVNALVFWVRRADRDKLRVVLVSKLDASLTHQGRIIWWW